MKTPLYDIHTRLGAKFTDFHGWRMPLHYGSIISEVKAVRQSCGVFDISHMARFLLKGEGAFEALQRLTTNDLNKLVPGKVQYSLLLNERGGVKDDITVYMISPREFFICANAGNRVKVREWIGEHFPIEDVSDRTLQIALQGRDSEGLLSRFYDVSELKYYRFKRFGNTMVSRTGYTGERGYEIYTDVETGRELFKELSSSAQPCGLGARDVLRIEAGFPLYGNELSEDITPLEASLDRFVSFDKDFIGKEALLAQKPRRKLVKLLLEGKGVPRRGYPILWKGDKVGVITSGTFSPTLRAGIAMGLLDVDKLDVPEVFQVDIRGTEVAAKIVGSFVAPSP